MQKVCMYVHIYTLYMIFSVSRYVYLKREREKKRGGGERHLLASSNKSESDLSSYLRSLDMAGH